MVRRSILVGIVVLLGGLLAACGGQGDKAPTAGTIQVVTENLRFKPSTLTVKAGQKVTVNLVNRDGVPHTFEVEGVPGVGIGVAPGGKATLEFTVEQPGTYTIFCGVGNHRAQGMVGQLTVEP